MSSATQSAPGAAALATELEATGTGSGRPAAAKKPDRWYKPRTIVGKVILWIVAIGSAVTV